ncbi:hypothetical protein SAMN04488490_1713 [Marinobacter sp. LV10R510-11A]|uniref:hypothetical protein n=1 Tax=Marinobacter sp. LV10R510-11A TaxID=1415568 RepID=UPI000BB74862|nr:hypothetical protein [Marinobacter sp. LV10R510-11A]SOB76042.1 hypothetical protein SAMN04488490_1713 [Marinobacter sp. LV10R510-11A]
MIRLRLALGFIVSAIVCIKLQNDVLNFGRFYSAIASGFLSAAISFLIFIYGKWFIHILRETNGKISIFWRFFDLFIVPASPIYIFTLSFSPAAAFEPEFFIPLLACVAILSDPGRKIEHFLWKRRFHGFEKLPDSGEVRLRELVEKKWLVISLYVFLPMGGYFISPIYIDAIS